MSSNNGLSGSSFNFEDYPEVDRRSCRLLGPTALVVQALMGVLAILSLVFKRQREKPKRPWRIWLFDVSKQVVGQMVVHGLNVLISDVGAHHKSVNACVFYFLNVLIDTTVGVGIIYIVLHLLTYLLTEKLLLKGFESGMYGTPPSVKYWACQAAVYVFSLITMKLSVIMLFAFVPAIFKLGEWLLSWTQIGSSDAFQVIFTMGIFPIIMNVLQFWLIDSIVKASSSSVVRAAELAPDSPDDDDREPLFAAPLDDDDAPRIHDIENPIPRPASETHLASNGASTIADENKSSGLATPINASHNSEIISVTHAYPPSVSGSTPSTLPLSSMSPKQPHRHESTPPPLILTRPSPQLAIKSPQIPIQPSQFAQRQSHDDADHSSQEWASSWGDSDDWADKVSESELLSGRSLQEKARLVSWDHATIQVR